MNILKCSQVFQLSLYSGFNVEYISQTFQIIVNKIFTGEDKGAKWEWEAVHLYDDVNAAGKIKSVPLNHYSSFQDSQRWDPNQKQQLLCKLYLTGVNEAVKGHLPLPRGGNFSSAICS